MNDKDYEAINVKIFDDEKSVLENSEILAQLNLPSSLYLRNFSQNKTLVGILNPYQNTNELDELVKKKLIVFH